MHEPAICEHCGEMFEPDARLAGAIASCPRCGKAVEIPGLRDPLWFLIRGLAVAAAIGIGVVVGMTAGPIVGFGAGAAALMAAWLLSRAL